MILTLQELLTGKKRSGSSADAAAPSAHASAGSRSEHYAFFEEKTEPAELPAKANQALKQAKVKARPTKVFSKLNGFSVQLNESEADLLREVPSIQSVELDRPLPLSPPVEVKPVSSSSSTSAPVAVSTESRALDQEVRLEKVFSSDTTESSDADHWDQESISSGNREVFCLQQWCGGLGHACLLPHAEAFDNHCQTLVSVMGFPKRRGPPQQMRHPSI